MQKRHTFQRSVLAATVVLSIATACIAGAQSTGTRLFAITTSDSIEELDPASGATLRSIAKPEEVSPGPDGLAYDGTSLYFISSFGTNTIYQLDPESGATLRTINPDVSCSIDALAHSGLFIYGLCYDTDEVYRIDPATGATLLTYPAMSSILGGMTFAGTRGTLFVSSGNAVLEVDPETGLQVGSLNIGTQTYGLGFSNASGLLFAGTIDGMVLALDPTDGSLQYSFSVGSTPYALAADEALVHEGRALVAIPSSLDFGAVEVGTTASGTIRLVSAGTEPVTVSAIQVESGDAAVADAPVLPVQIAAGESVSFSVEVTAVATGPIEAVIRVESDDDTQPVRMLPVSASGLEVQPAEAGLLYGTTGGVDGGRLITIDASTGAGTLIGDVPAERLPGFAIDSQGRLFAAGPDGVIYRLDAATGTPVGAINTGLGRMAALSFDSNDVLYAIAYDGMFKLFTIDPASGAVTSIAIINQFINGMSFSPIDGTLWAATTDQIYTIDTVTGAERLVGAAGLSRITDIQFDTDGNLYGTAGGGEEENQLVIIDQATGSASVVGPIGFSSVSGLAARLLPQEGSHLALLPPTVNFGSVAVGETAERAVVLRSVGTSAVAITSISSPAAPFTTVAEPTALPLTLQPGEEELLTLAFSPSAAGTFESEITVSSTDTDQPNKSVRL